MTSSSQKIILFDEKLTFRERVLDNIIVSVIAIFFTATIVFVIGELFTGALMISLVIVSLAFGVYRRSKNYVSFLSITGDYATLKYYVFDKEYIKERISLNLLKVTLKSHWSNPRGVRQLNIWIDGAELLSQKQIGKWNDEKFKEVMEKLNN